MIIIKGLFAKNSAILKIKKLNLSKKIDFKKVFLELSILFETKNSAIALTDAVNTRYSVI
jgi:hypothetical protein